MKRSLLVATLVPALAASLSGFQPSQSGALRIAIVTATRPADQFADPEEYQRREAVKDLAGSLSARMNVTIVPVEKHPDLVVTITTYDKRRSGASKASGLAVPLPGGAVLGDSKSTPIAEVFLGVSLTVPGRDYRVDIEGVGTDRGRAARDVAQTITTWAKDNRDRLRPPAKKK